MHAVYRHGSALCSFSGPRLHQERLPRLCASDIGGGGVSSEGVLAAQWSVWATGGCRWVISAGPVLAWTHPHAPAVPREAWGRRVSLHGVRTLWGSLVRVCPAIQRLPVCLPDRLGGTSEFLWLPFRLRKCVVLALLSPTSLYPQAASPLYWHCGIAVMLSCASKVASSITSRDEAIESLVKDTFGGSRTGANSRASCTEAQRGPAFVSLPSLPSVLGDLEGVGLLLSLCASPSINRRSLCWLCVTIALWTEVGGKTEARPFVTDTWIGLYV